MITRLLGVLVCVLLPAYVGRAEADFDFRQLQGDFRVNGKSEFTQFTQKSAAHSAHVVHKTIPLEFFLRHSTRNSFTIVWQPAGVPNVIANTIEWVGMPDSPMGELEVGGAFHVHRGAGLIGGFHASSRLHRTEDGQGVIIEEQNLKIRHEFDWKRIAMPHFRMVIRPGRIVIVFTNDTFSHGMTSRQKLTAEIDY